MFLGQLQTIYHYIQMYKIVCISDVHLVTPNALSNKVDLIS